jgi:hypothetical protein
MAKYLLILSDQPISYTGLSPEEMQTLLSKYRAWSRKLAEAGRLHGGQKLKDEGGKVMTQKGGQVSVVDGPFSETKEIIGGFYLIEARDYAEAVELSRDCPHLAHGKIDIREIEVLP